MKILQVVHAFPPHSHGGAEKYTQQLAQALSERHEVHVLYPRAGSGTFAINDKVEGALQLHEIDLPGPGIRREKIADYGRISQSYVDPSVDVRFRDFVELLTPDVIHFQHLKYLSTGLISTAEILGLGRIMTLHDYWFLCPTVQLIRHNQEVCPGPEPSLCRECWTDRQARLLAKRGQGHPVVKGALHALAKPYLKAINEERAFQARTEAMLDSLMRLDKLIAPSRFLQETFANHGIPKERIVVSRNGYDCAEFGFKPQKAERPNGRGPITFGFLGRIMPIKGVHVLLESFNRLEENAARLLIFGQYDERSIYFRELERIRGNRSDVAFMGLATDIGKVFEAVDVLVFPSLWYENGPLVLAESNLAGVPVIASNLGAIPEFVQEGRNGLLFEPGDVTELARKMSEFVRHPELISKLSAGAAFWPPSIKEQALEIEQIYMEIV